MTTILGSTMTPNSRPAIYNSLESTLLDVIAVTGEASVTTIVAQRVNIYTQALASQINEQRAMYDPPPYTCTDLEQFVCDIKIETAVQGSSFLTLSLIDPGWKLFQRGSNGASFIDVDQNGYLWPPIEVNFPQNVSDATWRLCGCQPSIDTTQANMVLIFEDKIVAELREHDQYTDPSCAVSQPNETRAEYVKRCIATASGNPQIAHFDGAIRFIPLLPTRAFTPDDLVTTETTPPSSATQPNVSGARANFTKQPGIAISDRVDTPGGGTESYAASVAGLNLGAPATSTSISISDGMGGSAGSPNFNAPATLAGRIDTPGGGTETQASSVAGLKR